MEKLFDKNDSYVIRFAAKQGENNYKVVVAHSDEIGKQSGIFNYESFLEKFDTPFEKKSDLFVPLPKDIDFVRKVLSEGISSEEILQALEIYGSSQCKNKSYVKAVMESDEVQKILEKMPKKEKSTEFAR